MSAPLLRAVVVDDEPMAREAVLTLIEDESAIEVVGQAGNGGEAVEVVRRARPDLLFLDVQMPDLDGFQVLERLGESVPPAVVFVTAHDRHALRAFEVHALDYLLKPFGRPRFHAAVARAIERLSAAEALTLQRTIASLVRESPERDPAAGVLAAGPDEEPRDRPGRIAVRTGERTVFVDVASIDWIEAQGDYARLHVGERRHLLAERMHVLEGLLDPRRFLRVHRSIIVRLDGIDELRRDPDGSGSIVLGTGVRLRVARGRWDALQRALGIARS